MSNTSAAVKITFKGQHPQLINGQKYTFRQLTEITGISDTVLRYRLNGFDVMTSNDLKRPAKGFKIKRSSGNPVLGFSQTWLRRNLI